MNTNLQRWINYLTTNPNLPNWDWEKWSPYNYLPNCFPESFKLSGPTDVPCRMNNQFITADYIAEFLGLSSYASEYLHYESKPQGYSQEAYLHDLTMFADI